MEANEPQQSQLYDKLLPRIEPAAGLLALVGLAAKWSLLSWGNALLLVGGMGLALCAFLSAFHPAIPTVPAAPTPSSAAPKRSFVLDTLVPKYTGIGGAVVIIGAVFELMSLSGSRAMLLVGTGTMLIVMLLLAINQRLDKRVLLLALLGSLMLSIAPETWVRQFHRDDPVLVEKMIYQIQHPRDTAAAAAVRRHIQQKRAAR